MLWFEIIIIFKDETLNLQGIKTLSKIHICWKMTKKIKCHVIGQQQAFIIISCKKICSKIHSYGKKNWGKGHAFLFYTNHVGSLYPICTLE
jgi:hypothetical protein